MKTQLMPLLPLIGFVLLSCNENPATFQNSSSGVAQTKATPPPVTPSAGQEIAVDSQKPAPKMESFCDKQIIQLKPGIMNEISWIQSSYAKNQNWNDAAYLRIAEKLKADQVFDLMVQYGQLLSESKLDTHSEDIKAGLTKIHSKLHDLFLDEAEQFFLSQAPTPFICTYGSGELINQNGDVPGYRNEKVDFSMTCNLNNDKRNQISLNFYGDGNYQIKNGVKKGPSLLLSKGLWKLTEVLLNDKNYISEVYTNNDFPLNADGVRSLNDEMAFIRDPDSEVTEFILLNKRDETNLYNKLMNAALPAECKIK